MATTNKKRTLKRKCMICDKSMTITVYEDNHYRDGHYFGISKDPVGKGEYKKVGKQKLFGKEVDVVEWTGKEKEVENWECNTCNDQAKCECWLEQNIEKLYGERCKDQEQNCACCQAWGVYDTIVDQNRGKL